MASYRTARAAAATSATERARISAQLGRPARGDNAVVHRCVFGLPVVVRVAPRLEDGTPFPTTFWLTCPLLRRRIGTLEAEGAMREVDQRLATDPEFARAHATAVHRYREFRAELGPRPPGDPTVGGSDRHVKCLHVHAAHTLATNDGPVGAWTLARVLPMPCPGPCVEPAP